MQATYQSYAQRCFATGQSIKTSQFCWMLPIALNSQFAPAKHASSHLAPHASTATPANSGCGWPPAPRLDVLPDALLTRRKTSAGPDASWQAIGCWLRGQWAPDDFVLERFVQNMHRATEFLHAISRNLWVAPRPREMGQSAGATPERSAPTFDSEDGATLRTHITLAHEGLDWKDQARHTQTAMSLLVALARQGRLYWNDAMAGAGSSARQIAFAFAHDATIEHLMAQGADDVREAILRAHPENEQGDVATFLAWRVQRRYEEFIADGSCAHLGVKTRDFALQFACTQALRDAVLEVAGPHFRHGASLVESGTLHAMRAQVYPDLDALRRAFVSWVHDPLIFKAMCAAGLQLMPSSVQQSDESGVTHDDAAARFALMVAHVHRAGQGAVR